MSEWWLAIDGGPALSVADQQQLAALAYGYSDQVALVDARTVVLEVGHSQRLHGQPDAQAQALWAELDQVSLVGQLGAAATVSAAVVLSRCHQTVWPGQALAPVLHALPLSVLSESVPELRSLAACGLNQLGELMALPRAECNRRLGPALGRWLDQLEGRGPLALTYWRPDPHYYQRVELPHPTHSSQVLQRDIRRALQPMWGWLRQHGRALSRLRLSLRGEPPQPTVVIDIGLSRASLDPSHLDQLLALKLDQCRLQADVHRLVIQIEDSAPLEAEQVDAWSPSISSEDWSGLIDRLRARLGSDQVSGLSALADHRPERAWGWQALETVEDHTCNAPRPTWLLPQPRPCQRDQLQLEEGPERIEGGWWDGPEGRCQRDYWVARDAQGRQLWVYRQADCRWFIHGLFG